MLLSRSSAKGIFTILAVTLLTLPALGCNLTSLGVLKDRESDQAASVPSPEAIQGSPTPSASEPSRTASLRPSLTATQMPETTHTPDNTPTKTQTFTPTLSPSPNPTCTPTSTPRPIPTPSETPCPTPTLTRAAPTMPRLDTPIPLPEEDEISTVDYHFLPIGEAAPEPGHPCPGCPNAPGYIIGNVFDSGGKPLCGVRIVCYNDWHRYPVVGSKGGGEYDIPVIQAETTWRVVVLDEFDQPLSPEVPVHFNPLQACWYRLNWQRVD